MSRALTPMLVALGILAAWTVAAVADTSVDSDQKHLTLKPGFESGISLGTGLIYSSLAAGDLDGDGRNEVVVCGRDGNVYACVPGCTDNPVLFLSPDGARVYGAPALVDLDGDGRPDVLWGTDAGRVYLGGYGHYTGFGMPSSGAGSVVLPDANLLAPSGPTDHLSGLKPVPAGSLPAEDDDPDTDQ